MVFESSPPLTKTELETLDLTLISNSLFCYLFDVITKLEITFIIIFNV